jgi:hypothetical protein
MIKMTIKTNLSGISKTIGKARKATQPIVDQQILKDSNAYIPADQWHLRDSSLKHSDIGKGRLMWVTPYARRLYYNPQYNFSKDKNPKAGGLWFERAKSADGRHWIELARKEMRRNL